MKSKIGSLTLGLALCAGLSTGCAAVFKGSAQDVTFTSVPGTSDVRIDNRYAGATPVTAEVDRNQSQNVRISKEGFKDERVHIQRRPDTPWWVWDISTCVIPITLCIPVLVDAISGAWFSLDDEVHVKLDPLPIPVSPHAVQPAPEAPASSAPTP